jgi:membrane protein DedA with SNARE-associated domain
MFNDFILHWGAWAVAVGTFFEGETIVVAAGAMAHNGLLVFHEVAFAAFLGSTLGDTAWFLGGRFFGRPFIDRNEKWKKRSERIQQFTKRFGVAFVLIFRFVYGIRTVTPAVLGATHYPVGRFMMLNAISAAVWAVAFTSIGWGLGEALRYALARRGHILELVAAAIVLTIVLWTAWIFLKKKTPLDDTPSAEPVAEPEADERR